MVAAKHDRLSEAHDEQATSHDRAADKIEAANRQKEANDSGDLRKDDMKTANEQGSGIFEKYTLPLHKDNPVPGEGGGRVAGAKTDTDGGSRTITSAAQLASGTAHAMSLKAGDPASQMAAAKAQVDAVSAWTDARKVALRDGNAAVAEAAGMFASGHEILSRFHNALLND